MGKIKQLTENSWLISAGSQNSGLLFLQNNTYIFMSTDRRQEFNDMAGVKKRFGNLKEDSEEVQDTLTSILGFPIKHERVENISDNPPLYRRGNVVFAAGYWGLKYPHGWTLAFCPKYDTCQAYETSGPFRNRLEALNRLTALNNNQALKDRHQ